MVVMSLAATGGIAGAWVGEPESHWLGRLAWAAVWLGGGLMVTFLVVGELPTRIEVDPAAKTLRVVNRHWPWPAEVRSFPLDKVRDAIVEVHADDGLTYEAALVVDGDDEPVSLARMSDGNRARHAKVADQVRALLVEHRRPDLRSEVDERDDGLREDRAQRGSSVPRL